MSRLGLVTACRPLSLTQLAFIFGDFLTCGLLQHQEMRAVHPSHIQPLERD